MTAYRLFGRTLHAEVALPFASGTGGKPLRLELESVEVPTGSPVHEAPDPGTGRLLRIHREDGSGVVISYDGWRSRYDGTTLRLDETGETHAARLSVLLERVFVPISLLVVEPELVAIHGASAVVAEGAVVLVGDSGVGKSTTLLELRRRGHRIVSDDMTVIDTRANMALPGGAYVRLWAEPGAVPEATEEHPVAADTNKRMFWFEQAPEPAPIAAFVVLCRGPEHLLEELHGHERAAAVLAQTFDLTDGFTEWKTRRMRNVVACVEKCPVFRYESPPDSSGRASHVDDLLERLEAGGLA